jgi:hypothetical protein
MIDAGGTKRQKSVRRTVLILSTIALAFYIGFILVGVLRA